MASRGLDFGQLLHKQPDFLARAAGVGSLEGLRFLVEHGGDPQFRDWQDATLLHYAARTEAQRLSGPLPTGLGLAASAAELAAQSPAGGKLLAALEAYAAERRPLP